MHNLLKSDSYKYSHWKMLPPDLEHMWWYLESRGGPTESVVNFGLQGLLKELFAEPLTHGDVDEAREVVDAHMGPGVFNVDGFRRIVSEYGGYPPLEISAPPEGLEIPTRNILLSVENLEECPEMAWLPGFYETRLLNVWYPITVATVSRRIRKLILASLERTGTPALVDFKLHDFGYRGVSSEQSAGRGGLAHLLNFQGTDTIEALEYGRAYYYASMPGYSIPASEHSIVMAWQNEQDAYAHIFDQFAHAPMVASVSDTYDVYQAVDYIYGQMLREQIEHMSATLVVRPDSGVPNQVVRQVFEMLGERFGYTVNRKGFKVLNPKVRVIQGDGVDPEEVDRVLKALEVRGWSTDPLAFGMGGALLQKMSRDTYSFAMKPSRMTRGGRRVDIAKRPSTDPTKWSKSGKLKLVASGDTYETVPFDTPGVFDLLRPVWQNGELLVDESLALIRSRING